LEKIRLFGSHRKHINIIHQLPPFVNNYYIFCTKSTDRATAHTDVSDPNQNAPERHETLRGKASVQAVRFLYITY
jgi:hypothetical protein